MLMQTNLFGETALDLAIRIMREFEPPEGYYLAFSGGKDSTALKAVADIAGVRYDAHYSVTTIDPPELVRFIKEQHPDVDFDKPSRSFYAFVRDHRGLPMRHARWCCAELKERGGEGRVVLTGVRAAESSKRSRYGIVRHACAVEARPSSIPYFTGPPRTCGTSYMSRACPTAYCTTRASLAWAVSSVRLSAT